MKATFAERDSMLLSPRFEAAFTYAAHLHRAQVRKGNGAPYITHLMAVAALVGECTQEEDWIIAALLHDAVEDQGGLSTLAEIRERFGESVAELVLGCSDTWTQPKPPWRERKERYIAALEAAPQGVVVISCADKLHNLRSIEGEYLSTGEDLWTSFRGQRSGTCWYFRSLAAVYARRQVPARLLHPLQHTMARVFGDE